MIIQQYLRDFLLNTSQAAPGALAHRLKGPIACKIQNASPAPKWIVGHQKLIKISTRPSYVQMFYIPCLCRGRGELEGKIEIVEIWKNENKQKHYQLIIASAFADVSADFSG